MPQQSTIDWVTQTYGFTGDDALKMADWLEKGPGQFQPASNEEMASHGINVKRPDIGLDWVEQNMGLQGPEAQHMVQMLQSGVQIPGLKLPPTPSAPNNVPTGSGNPDTSFAVKGDDKQKHLETIRDLHQQRRQEIEAQLYDIFGLMHPDGLPNPSTNPNPSPQTPLITNSPQMSSPVPMSPMGNTSLGK